MCLNRESCERVFGEIEILRNLCRVLNRDRKYIEDKVINREMPVRESIDIINRCATESAKAGGGITKMIWKLCPDCRAIFYKDR